MGEKPPIMATDTSPVSVIPHRLMRNLDRNWKLFLWAGREPGLVTCEPVKGARQLDVTTEKLQQMR